MSAITADLTIEAEADEAGVVKRKHTITVRIEETERYGASINFTPREVRAFLIRLKALVDECPPDDDQKRP